ncbi:MAG: GNAT family N-acetyltransferase [Proteobacteria bacterium]|uniref:GNAT family N-acetyltransferase n=1 Tax=Rudaea sp. TaxID=2136325 RepID=UPI00321FB26D|nr:GNAT family N-acetyltransferase [Pseudomonadota bacterium]
MTQVAPDDTIHVCMIESGDALADLGERWERLHADARLASVFSGFDWQHLWWRNYGRGRQLRLLLAFDGEALVGILPLHVERVRMLCWPVRQLRFVGTGGDTSPDDLGPVLMRGRESEVAQALAKAVMELAGWDVLALTDMNPACAFTTAIEAVARRSRLACRSGCSERIAFMRLPTSWDDWLASLHRDRRYRVRNIRKKLVAAHPDARFFVWNDATTLDAGIDRLMYLHRKRWRASGESHGFSSSEYVAFHRAVMAACLARDRLRLYCLEIGGNIAAMFYFYRFRDSVYLMQSGFDPDYADLKPGQVLLGHVIEHAIGEGHAMLDFLRGEHRYKDELATGKRETVFVQVQRIRLGALAYQVRRRWLPALKRSFKAKLNASGS